MFGIGKWRLLGIAGVSPFFCGAYCCCAGCPGKKLFVLELESDDCWDLLGFLLFALSAAAWQFAREKNDKWVGKIIFVKLEGDLLAFPGFCVVYCFLANCREKKMIFGLLNNFWVEKRRLLQFAEVSPFCVVYCCLAD